MVRLAILFFIFAASLYASDNSEILKRADDYMKTKTKSNIVRAYNDYKSLYLRSISDGDIKLQDSALRGIIKSGNRLNIDVTKYSGELKNLSKNSGRNQSKSNLTSESKQAENIHIQSSHKLESAEWSDGKLVLRFDQLLNSDQINYFTLYDAKAKSYKYVFDVQNSMLNKSQNLSKNGIKRIKLAQFKPSILRLVIENGSAVKINYKRISKELIVDIDSGVEEIASVNTSTLKKVDTYKTIVIDAGHGGKDPGAVGYRRYREKIVVFKVAKELQKILKSRGYKVYMTRDNDEYVKLSSRTKYANNRNADIFISIHANAVSKRKANEVNGIECYFLSPSRSSKAKSVALLENSADLSDMNMYGKDSFLNLLNHHNILASNKLAIDLQRGMLGSLNKQYKNVTDGGVREGPFWVLVGAQMPSVLVEVGFITHPTEARRLVDNMYRKTLATGIANGIERYFAKN